VKAVLGEELKLRREGFVKAVGFKPRAKERERRGYAWTARAQLGCQCRVEFSWSCVRWCSTSDTAVSSGTFLFLLLYRKTSVRKYH